VASANVDLVRSIYADWERGDFSSAEWAHPEIELVNDDGPAPGTWKGVAAMAESWRDFLGTWEEYRVEVEEYRELDDERVLVLMLHCGRGKTSGLEVGQIGTKRAGANLLHVRDGKVTRLVLYWAREHALADLGLAPESGSSST
jgi:ketosteroid isomerase-like protein